MLLSAGRKENLTPRHVTSFLRRQPWGVIGAKGVGCAQGLRAPGYGQSLFCFLCFCFFESFISFAGLSFRTKTSHCLFMLDGVVWSASDKTLHQSRRRSTVLQDYDRVRTCVTLT